MTLFSFALEIGAFEEKARPPAAEHIKHQIYVI